MQTGRPRRLAISLSLAALGLWPGCASSGPLLSRQASVGTLKTSVSRLEYENEQLRRELAEAKSENRRISLRLDQEEAANGELTARLDDARNLISKQGSDVGGLAGTARTSLHAEPADPRPTPPPAGRKPYKPPFAQIRGRIDVPPPDEEPADDPPAPSRGVSRGSLRRDDLDLGPQSRREGPSPWLPVARGLGAATAGVR
jgi:outer membrane murein-binding lipoprotein Lpp